MAKKHLTFDCPVCEQADEVVARVTEQDRWAGTAKGDVVGHVKGRWICFACRSEGDWQAELHPFIGKTNVPEPTDA